MQIFGLTPIDTAYSVLGLNLAYKLTEYVFVSTKIAFIAFFIGALYCLWLCVRDGNYRRLIGQAALWLLAVLFILPSTSLTDYKSASEEYKPTDIELVSAQSIKNTLISADRVPLVLSWVAYSMDSFSIGMIHLLSRMIPGGIDQSLGLEYANYLGFPFGLQEYSLRIHQQLNDAQLPYYLSNSVQLFAYKHFLPALVMYKKEAGGYKRVGIDGPLVAQGAGENIFTALEYLEAKRKVKEQFNAYLEDRTPGSLAYDWRFSKRMLQSYYGPEQEIVKDEFLMTALIRKESERLLLPKLTSIQEDFPWRLSGFLLRSYPHAQGAFNLLLYLCFPFIVLYVFLLSRWQILLYYVTSFLWVKSMPITAFIAYLLSLSVAHIQSQLTPSSISWFWQSPYFVLTSGILLYLMPLMSFFIINRVVNLNK